MNEEKTADLRPSTEAETEDVARSDRFSGLMKVRTPSKIEIAEAVDDADTQPLPVVRG